MYSENEKMSNIKMKNTQPCYNIAALFEMDKKMHDSLIRETVVKEMKKLKKTSGNAYKKIHDDKKFYIENPDAVENRVSYNIIMYFFRQRFLPNGGLDYDPEKVTVIVSSKEEENLLYFIMQAIEFRLEVSNSAIHSVLGQIIG